MYLNFIGHTTYYTFLYNHLEYPLKYLALN